ITPCMQLVPVNGRLVPSFEETLLMCRRVGVGQANGYVLAALGYAARLTGDPAAATAAVGQAVEVFTELKDDLARAQALHQLGCLHRDSGDFAAAEAALGQARDLRMTLGDRRGELLTEVNMALLLAKRGDVTAGLDAARRVLAAFEAIGDTAGTGGALTILAAIELLSGQVRAAREMYARAAEQLAVWGRMPAWQHLMVAELSVELADHGRAQREIQTAATTLDKLGCIVAGQRLAALRSELRSR
ncbi:MAG TPA: tetratricopeptide repeat protein, partial [Nakamurella sp.]|nr:tetratricopeptide repeat protein [Nakamurella sp.]